MIVVHGGVGNVSKDRHEKVRAGLRAAAAAGRAILDRGGAALDAAVAAVRLLEDNPDFGAGLGSALTREGTVETCASVMDGATRRAGAVAAVPDLGAPVILARAVLELGEHVILAGPAAARFAHEIGIPLAQPGALVTERARAEAQAAIAHGARAGAPSAGGKPVPPPSGGGVGAVARDKNGNLAAASSTGGTVNRRLGCVDDACVPGVGLWADPEVAICTSGGEALFRFAFAHRVATRSDDGLRAAIKSALVEMKKLGAETMAGAIAINKNSWAALQLGPTMPVAWIDEFGAKEEMGFEL
jgi:L-asparaginase / beta-aspartyl-peptidase